MNSYHNIKKKKKKKKKKTKKKKKKKPEHSTSHKKINTKLRKCIFKCVIHTIHPNLFALISNQAIIFTAIGAMSTTFVNMKALCINNKQTLN